MRRENSIKHYSVEARAKSSLKRCTIRLNLRLYHKRSCYMKKYSTAKSFPLDDWMRDQGNVCLHISNEHACTLCCLRPEPLNFGLFRLLASVHRLSKQSVKHEKSKHVSIYRKQVFLKELTYAFEEGVFLQICQKQLLQ